RLLQNRRYRITPPPIRPGKGAGGRRRKALGTVAHQKRGRLRRGKLVLTFTTQDCINTDVLSCNRRFREGHPLANLDFVFTSESVSEGHPDKICDRISDAIVDTFIAVEPQARCGVETLVTTNCVVLAGEVRGPASITGERLIDVARTAIREIGYEQENF